MLPGDTFKIVTAATPLISIDFIVKNKNGNILLGKRVNRPAQGFWFVPGGRVLKDEPFELAFKRLIKAELGLSKVVSTFKGVYQHFYEDNFSEDKFTTHYVVLAYEIYFNDKLSSLPDEQHSEYQWMSQSDLLMHNEVHTHTKWYFQKDKQADLLFK
jgi:colanic acid biosynthesis protein WcaH